MNWLGALTSLPTGLSWAHPWVLWTMAAVVLWPVGRLLLLRKEAIPVATRQYNRSPLWPRLLTLARIGAEAAVFALVITGLAGPYREDEVTTIREDGIDVALALDVSASMMAADFEPNRLEALKKISADFVQRSASNRTAVYAFALDVFTQTPLTSDHAVILELLDAISYEIIDHSKSGGTALGDALLAAGADLLSNRIPGRDQVVILITDGESNVGADPILGARYLAAHNIRLHVIGIGGEKEVEVYVHGKPFITSNQTVLKTKLDDKQLKEIAVAANGHYHRAADTGLLTSIFDKLSRLERSSIEVEKYRSRRHYSWYASLSSVPFLFVWLGLSLFVRRPML